MIRRDVVSTGKYVYQAQSSVTCDIIPDPADLDLEQDIVNQNYVSPSHKFEIQQMHYLTVELHMCYFQKRCFQEELDPSK